LLTVKVTEVNQASYLYGFGQVSGSEIMYNNNKSKFLATELRK